MAITAMREKQGLTVVPFPASLEAEWRASLNQMYPQIRGKLVPAETFDAAVAALTTYRSAAAGPQSGH
jgi:hypothetical protein